MGRRLDRRGQVLGKGRLSLTFRVGLALLTLALSACTDDSDDGPSPVVDDPSVLFTTATPGDYDEGGPGSVMALTLTTDKRPLHVTAVDPVADDGLKVTYLGWSRCTRGCVGLLKWDDEGKQLARESIDGTVPFDVPVGHHPSLTFLLEPEGVGLEMIRTQCLVVYSVVLTLGDGRRVAARFNGESAVAALGLAALGPSGPQRPEGYKTCTEQMRTSGT